MSSIHDSLTSPFTPEQIIEVRAISDDGMAFGYLYSLESLVQKVSILGDEVRDLGIYVILNKVNPALPARRTNRIKTRLSKKNSTTADTDILDGSGSLLIVIRSGHPGFHLKRMNMPLLSDLVIR